MDIVEWRIEMVIMMVMRLVGDVDVVVMENDDSCIN